MVIVLPDDANNFVNLERTLTNKNIFSDLLNKMSIDKIYLGVPKFKIELTLDLTKSLPQVSIKINYSKIYTALVFLYIKKTFII